MLDLEERMVVAVASHKGLFLPFPLLISYIKSEKFKN